MALQVNVGGHVSPKVDVLTGKKWAAQNHKKDNLSQSVPTLRVFRFSRTSRFCQKSSMTSSKPDCAPTQIKVLFWIQVLNLP